MSNESRVTVSGQEDVRPGREATTGVHIGTPDPASRARELAVSVPSRVRNGDSAGSADGHDAGGDRKHGHHKRNDEDRPEFTSYYGLPVINQPVWEGRDIAGYLFLGGLAGGSAIVGAGSHLTGRRTLAKVSKVAAAGAAGLSVAALIHDLGRPSRFLNMLRVFKPTSPMNLGSWLLAAFGPAAAVSAACEVSGRFPWLGGMSTAAAAALGPGVAAYTGALLSDTAVPSWHGAYREMPFVFVASGASAAAGLGLALAPPAETRPVKRLGIVAGVAVLAATEVMERRMGMVAEPYHEGRAARYMRMGRTCSALGTVGVLFAGKRRAVNLASGAALVAGSAFERFGIFHAGVASANDPRYTIVHQRERLAASGRTWP